MRKIRNSAEYFFIKVKYNKRVSFFLVIFTTLINSCYKPCCFIDFNSCDNENPLLHASFHSENKRLKCVLSTNLQKYWLSFKIPDNLKTIDLKVYLEPIQTSMMKLFCENS